MDATEPAAYVDSPQKVLFICTHNSARSQMAEGWLRWLGGVRYEVYSAGMEATRLRPAAEAVMREVGIDISAQHSKSLHRYVGQSFDQVITVCDQAAEACPIFPGAKSLAHWSFEDPSAVEGTEGERRAVFRKARDQIRERIEELLSATSSGDNASAIDASGKAI